MFDDVNPFGDCLFLSNKSLSEYSLSHVIKKATRGCDCIRAEGTAEWDVLGNVLVQRLEREAHGEVKSA